MGNKASYAEKFIKKTVADYIFFVVQVGNEEEIYAKVSSHH